MRRAMMGGRKKTLVTKRFYPHGDYTWTVPAGVYEVDVFLVGGGGGCQVARGLYKGGAGGGYTKTYKKSTEGYRDGDAIKVTPGEKIKIHVGEGGPYWASGYGERYYGGYSWFKDEAMYSAAGGYPGHTSETEENSQYAKGGSTGGAYQSSGGYDGGDTSYWVVGHNRGQGYTTRDFGEPTGKRNAGGGGGQYRDGGASDYSEGRGGDGGTNGGRGGGGYGGGAGASNDSSSVKGGDGTVLIRYRV